MLGRGRNLFGSGPRVASWQLVRDLPHAANLKGCTARMAWKVDSIGKARNKGLKREPMEDRGRWAREGLSKWQTPMGVASCEKGVRLALRANER